VNADISQREEHVDILIAEDSPTQAQRLRHLLEEHGYEVTVATTGAEALVSARHKKPALIVSDVVMPEMDGYAFCKAVKSDDQLKDIPVILLTSLASAENVLKGLQCGADNFIRKPYEEKYLLARVHYALTNRTLRAQEKVQVGVHISFGGERHLITADRQQILDLLMSTYDEAVQLSDDLKAGEEQLARSNRTLAVVYRIAKGLNSATSQQAVLDRVLEEAMTLPSVQGGWFLLREGATGIRCAATRNLPPALTIPGALEHDCQCRRALREGELSRAAKIVECELLQQAQGDTWGLRCHCSVPLWAGPRMVGVINLIGLGEGSFRDDELQMLSGLGDQVALALERVAAEARSEQYAQQLAERVEVAEAKYRTLMQHANDAIFIVDPAGSVLEVNQHAEIMLGRARQEMVGRSYIDLVSPTSHDAAAVHFRQLLRSGTLHADDIHMRHSDGRQVCGDFSASVVPVQGELVVLAIVRDVTERNRLARQFQQAQKMEVVGRLAGGVAHDFNNMLTAILGYSELLLDEFPEGDRRRRDVQEIQKAGQSAAALTRQLLAFSRKQILQAVIVDLNASVRGMDGMMRRLIGEDVRITTRLHSELGRVNADPGQIEQVILNLAVNARDAMPEGGQLAIETSNADLNEDYADTHPGSAPGHYVALEVSDTGHGMDEDTQSHLFEPFFTTKAQGKGTGLGLATVYGIVKQSGGSISVCSEPGRGTTFSVYFPRVEGVLKAAGPGKSVAPAAIGTETVLIVEDDERLRTLARKALERYSYAVIDAASGDEALRLCEIHEGAIDLLLADVVMPGMTGPVLADRLGPLHPAMRVLFTSGYTDKTIVDRGVMAAGAAFIQKPYTPASLARKVRDVLDAAK
jgi:two-component system, cell cycle sensor histidine kinase and response regulator CckA